MINYYKLFDLLNRKGIKKLELMEQANFSRGTLAKLSSNKPVSISTINSICNVLLCQPGDIMEHIPDNQ